MQVSPKWNPSNRAKVKEKEKGGAKIAMQGHLKALHQDKPTTARKQTALTTT